jgi:hypothetical protein
MDSHQTNEETALMCDQLLRSCRAYFGHGDEATQKIGVVFVRALAQVMAELDMSEDDALDLAEHHIPIFLDLAKRKRVLLELTEPRH